MQIGKLRILFYIGNENNIPVVNEELIILGITFTILNFWLIFGIIWGK